MKCAQITEGRGPLSDESSLYRYFFQSFSSTYPQVVQYLLITFQSFPTLFNIVGKLVESFKRMMRELVS